MSDDGSNEERTPEQKLRDQQARRHFIFAATLILGCVLMLPVSGVVYVMLVELGWVASPIPQTPTASPTTTSPATAPPASASPASASPTTTTS